MSSGISSAIARSGADFTSPRIAIRSPPRKRNEAFARTSLTTTFSSSINCWTRARLVSTMWLTRNWSSRLPASSTIAIRVLGNVSTRSESCARQEYRDRQRCGHKDAKTNCLLCVSVVKRLPRRLSRNSLEPRPEPPDQSAQHDQANRDQLRPGHDPAKHRAPSRIVAQELKEIARHAIKEEISSDHLPIELLPLQQPHQNKEIGQLDRRLEKLRRLKRNS